MKYADKIKHFVVGAFIAGAAVWLTQSQYFMWGIVLIIALGKEAKDAWDNKKSSHSEFLDFVATCIPAAIISIAVWYNIL